MSKHGKKYRSAQESLSRIQVETLLESLTVVKDLSYEKFDASVDVDVNLGIDPTKGDQVVRGSVSLPHRPGEEPTVIVFAKGKSADEASAAGAEHVGAEDLVEKIKAGWMEFDYAVATPDVMGLVGRLAKLLGPRGLLPNKKVGTVTFNVAETVKELKAGKVFFRNDKGGSVHFSFGKVSFDVAKLSENLNAFVRALVAAKPSSSKGKFIRKMTISSTMGAGIQINPDELLRV